MGVDDQVILEDYLLTNIYLEDFADKASKRMSRELGIDQALLKTVFQAKASYLKGAIDAIETKYGSVDIFLEKEIGVGRIEKQKLIEILIE